MSRWRRASSRRTRLEYLSQSRRLYARACSSIDTLHHPSGLLPSVRALSRGEDVVVDGDAAETKGKDEGQSMAEGTKNRETEKTRAIRRRSPLGCRRSRVLSIDRWRNALGERGSRRVRARGSFVRAGRDATSVDMTHSGRSLTRNPKLIVPGGLDRARPREDDLSRRGIVRGVQCD